MKYSDIENFVLADNKDAIVDRIATLERQNAALRTNAEALLFTIGAGLVPLLTQNQKQAVENLRAALEAK